MESDYPVNAKHAELERKSAHPSSTRLVKSRGDDLGLEYLWNGDEYGSLENSLKTMGKNAENGGQPEILALMHVIERPITVHLFTMKTQTKALFLENFLLIALA